MSGGNIRTTSPDRRKSSVGFVRNEDQNQIQNEDEDLSPGSIEYMRYRLSIISNTIPPPKSKLTWIELGHEVITTNWSAISCPIRGEMKKVVLREQSGEIRGGTMVAVIGPNNSGKSTLLQLLAGLKTPGESSGRVLISPSRDEKVKIFFSSQKDALEEAFTVRQQLVFMAKVANRTENEFDDMINSLGLSNHQNDKICSLKSTTKQLVRAACGMITKPDILILDDITDGLDLIAASAIVNKLKEFSSGDDPIIVVSFTNYFPEVINNFDQLYVLSASGSCIYFGEQENIQDCFYEVSTQVSLKTSALDSLMEVALGLHGDHVVEQLTSRRTSSIVIMGESSGHTIAEVSRSQPLVSLYEQLFLLFNRELSATLLFLLTLIIIGTAFSVFLLIMESKTCKNFEENIASIIILVQLTNHACGLFLGHRTIKLMKEIEQNNWFHVSCYWIVQLFLNFLLAVIFLLSIAFFFIFSIYEIEYGSGDFEQAVLVILLVSTVSSSLSLLSMMIARGSFIIAAMGSIIIFVMADQTEVIKAKDFSKIGLMAAAKCDKRHLNIQNLLNLIYLVLVLHFTTWVILVWTRDKFMSAIKAVSKCYLSAYHRIYHELYVFFNPNSDERLRYDVTQRDARII